MNASTFEEVIAERDAAGEHDEATRWRALADQIGRTNAARLYNAHSGHAEIAETVSAFPTLNSHESPATTDSVIDSHIRNFGLAVNTLTTRPLECDHVIILTDGMWPYVSEHGPGYNRGAVEALGDARRAAQRGDRMAATLHLAAAQVATGERTIDSRLRLETRLRLGQNIDTLAALPTGHLHERAAELRSRETDGGYLREWAPTMREWPEPDGRAGAAVSAERLLLETIIEERERPTSI